MKDQFGGIIVEDANSQPVVGMQTDQFGGILLDVPETTDKIFFENIDPSILQKNEASINNAITFDSSKDEGVDLIENRENERQQTIQLAYSRFPKHTVDMWLNNPITMGEVGDFIDWSQVLPGGGIFQGSQALNLLNISEKLRDGKEVSIADKKILDDWLDKSIEMEVRQLTFGGKFRYYGSQLPAFMTEFALTSPVGKSAQIATVETTKRLVKNRVFNQVSGAATRVATQSALLMPTQGFEAFGNIRLSEGLEITETGQLIFREAKETPAISALKAYGYLTAEVAAELSGFALASKLNKSVRYQKGKISLKNAAITSVNKLPANLKDNLYKAYQSIKPNAKMSEVFARAGWNGMLMELGEERVADILRESVDLTLTEGYTMADVLEGITPDSEQLLLEAGLIMTVGGVKAGASAVTNLLINKGMSSLEAQEATKQLSTLEQDAIVDEQLKIDDTPLEKEGVEITVDEAIEQSAENINNPAPDVTTSGQQEQLNAGKEPETIAADESIFSDFYTKWVDDVFSFVAVAREAAKRGKENILEQSVRLYQGVTGMALSSLNNGTSILNDKGELIQTGKGLKPILNDFDFNTMQIEPNKNIRERDLNEYLIARRYLRDLKDREDVEVTDKQSEEAVKTMAKIADKYGENIVFFDTTAQEIYDYQDRMLQMLVSFGVMSKDKYDEIKKANPNYIPFQRVMDQEYGKDSGLQTLQYKGKLAFAGKKLKQVIKKIQGSDKEIINPIESIIRNTFRITDIAYQNRVVQQLVDLRDVMPEYIKTAKPKMRTMKDPETGKKIVRPAEVQPANFITVLEKGKTKYYEVHPSLVEAMASFSPQEITGLGWLLSRPASILRTGATITPEFMGRNFIRDIHGSYILSKGRPNPFDVVKGLFARIARNDLYEQWRASGASFNSYMNMSDKGVQNAYQEMFKSNGKLRRYLKNPISLPNDIGMIIEQSVRIAAYNAAKRKGLTDSEAAFEARDASIDFARGGTASKFVNRYIPFFNAGVQGADKFIRAAKNNPKALIMYAGATITVPQIILTGYYLHFAPEDEKQEYLEHPEWQRDLFWIFKVGDTWRRVPKPFTLGFIFGSSVERMMIWADSENIPEVKDMAFDLIRGTVSALSPVYDPSAVLPSPIKTVIEDVTNYSFFGDRNLYPEWMDKLPPELRKTSGTSMTAEELGKVLNYSPAKIDNIIRNTFATSGPYITDAGDFLLKQVKEWNGEEFAEDPTSPVDIPLLRAFAMRNPEGYISKSYNEFSETNKLINQIQQGMKEFEGERKIEYEKENEILISVTPIFKTQGKQIKKIEKQRKRVKEDLEMSGKEKELELLELDKQITNASRIANQALIDALDESIKDK